MPRAGWDDTIFALASGTAGAAIAIMRLSGPLSRVVLEQLVGKLPSARRASLRSIRSADGALIDHAIVLWLPGPASYSGEDSGELHLHASVAVVEAVADALTAAGARPAERGEFTRRAFLNGRMSLTEAEGVADLIAAETASQHTQALSQMAGGLAITVEAWASRLRGLLVAAEASIDFPDESDTAVEDPAALQALIDDIEQNLADDRAGERLRDGLQFVVTGAPNAGKSSLVNALAGQDVSIVSSQPGTTRDVVETRMIFGGVPVMLADTAGIRQSFDVIEAEGARRALARAAGADVVLSCAEAGQQSPFIAPDDRVIRVTTKIDLALSVPGTIGVSVVTGEGLDYLRTLLAHEARRLTASTRPAPFTRARHRAAGIQAATHLKKASLLVAPEIQAEEFRLAMAALGRITGHIDAEQILDDIFASFCIGK